MQIHQVEGREDVDRLVEEVRLQGEGERLQEGDLGRNLARGEGAYLLVGPQMAACPAAQVERQEEHQTRQVRHLGVEALLREDAEAEGRTWIRAALWTLLAARGKTAGKCDYVCPVVVVDITLRGTRSSSHNQSRDMDGSSLRKPTTAHCRALVGSVS